MGDEEEKCQWGGGDYGALKGQVKKVFKDRVTKWIKFCSLVKVWMILGYILVLESFPFIVLYEYNSEMHILLFWDLAHELY